MRKAQASTHSCENGVVMLPVTTPRQSSTCQQNPVYATVERSTRRNTPEEESRRRCISSEFTDEYVRRSQYLERC